MLKRYWPTLLLLTLVLVLQAQLWLGRGSLPEYLRLSQQTEAQLQVNIQLEARNEELQGELEDLKQGLEMLEERARYELRMIKPQEIFVQTQR